MSILSAPGHLFRLFRITATLARSGALAGIITQRSPKGWRRSIILFSTKCLSPFGKRGDTSMPPLSRSLAALGPAEVKFGQMMATRPDVVGPKAAVELSELQESMPAFDGKKAIEIIEAELGSPITELFADFDETPVAAASIAQVHKATTHDGLELAIKVLRPGIQKQFARDNAAFTFASKIMERVAPSSRRLRPVAVCEYFEQVTLSELNLQNESAAALEFYQNTKDDEKFKVPEVDLAFSSEQMLATEWIDGISLRDEAALNASSVNKKELAERVIQSFLKHALRDGLFHADMHQGNLRLDKEGNLVALDFGIMGRLDRSTRRAYADILLSFLRRDYERAAQVHRSAGYLDKNADLTEFAQALRATAEPIFGLGARNISMARLLGQLFAVTERFGMETQTQLLLLQKTMVMVEGVARDLDPDVNMWEAARPVVEGWMSENLGPVAMAKDLKRTLMTLSRLGPALPDAAEKFVSMVENPAPQNTPSQPHGSKWSIAAAGLAGGGIGALLMRFFE